MSYGHDYGRSGGPSDLTIAAVAIVALLAVAFGWKPAHNWYNELQHDRTVASQLKDRLEIQHGLTRSNDRVEGNAPVVVAGNMRLAVSKQPESWECGFRCATAVKDGDGYKVTLPVGYTYEPGEYQRSDNKEHFTTHPISELTYWSPKEHRLVTIKAEAGAGIPLPEELLVRKVDQMKVGEHGYVDGTITLETSPGAGVVYGFERVAPEPGDLMFGNSEMSVPITRTEEGFTVCVPHGGNLIYAPEEKPDGRKLFPARLASDC